MSFQETSGRAESHDRRFGHHEHGFQDVNGSITVTLELPGPLYRFARQVAEATKQPVEAVLQDSIAHTLPPLDDVSPEEMAELAELAGFNDAALWREARVTMTATEQAEVHDLLDRQGAGELTSA